VKNCGKWCVREEILRRILTTLTEKKKNNILENNLKKWIKNGYKD